MAYTDSDPVTASYTQTGLRIHDPLDPSTTLRTYLYARSERSSSIDTMPSGHWFAGRTFPVVDYGEHQDDAFDVSIRVPHGTTWQTDLVDLAAFAAARRTLCFRDGRGRLFFGSMRDYAERDEDWGTAVSFTVQRVYYDQAVA